MYHVPAITRIFSSSPYMPFTKAATELLPPFLLSSARHANRVPRHYTALAAENPNPIPNSFRPNMEISDCGRNMYASLLQECANVSALKELQANMIRTGFDHDIVLGTKLLHMCSSVGGATEYARQVFDKMPERNVFSWNAIIGRYARNGPFGEAIKLYREMKGEEGIRPDKYTFPVVLKACAGFSALRDGRKIHGDAVRNGFEADVFVGAALVDMYAKCGSGEEARRVFDKMPQRDSALWSAMIAGYMRKGDAKEALGIYFRMKFEGVVPDSATIVSVLPACAQLGALQQGKLIHAHVIKAGFEMHVSVGTAIVDMYAKCENVDSAYEFFNAMVEKNVVSWNAMIDGCVKNGVPNEALALFCQMQIEGLRVNSVTILIVLLACADLGALIEGKSVHGYLIRNGFEVDGPVGNSLVVMYARCGSTGSARELFDRMSVRDVVPWNAMIAGYAQNGHAREACILFKQLQVANVKPNSITLASMLPACADLAEVQQGKWIHAYVIKSGFEMNIPVMTALVALYARGADSETTQRLFENMSQRDLVSWNAMIGAYAQNGQVNQAVRLFRQMQLEGVIPNSVSLTCVLPAYAHLGALQQGRMIHAYIVRNGFQSDEYVVTSLMDMYAKCGRVDTARLLFDRMNQINVVSWSAMIAGYGMNGHGKKALELFFQMQKTGMKPTDVTFISVLSACSHGGLLEEGWQLFDSMTRVYCITPKVEHYACMVDLLGRAGHLNEAQDLIEKMPVKPSAGLWGTLLGACRIHRNIEIAKCVADCLLDLEPANAGYYILLSNVYATAGRWDEMVKVRQLMKDRGLKKTPGCSWIEVNKRIYSFFVGDRSHPESEKIYATLETMVKQIKEMGYVPDTDFVLHDVEEEMKVELLSCHSEKLAIAFGILNTRPGTPLHVTKNLRVCTDCHTATKFITKIASREIIMRDANRFHHFKDGLCSCNDYW